MPTPPSCAPTPVVPSIFRLGDERVASWPCFAGILAVVLYDIDVLLVDLATGVETRFIDAVATLSDNHEIICSGETDGNHSNHCAARSPDP